MDDAGAPLSAREVQLRLEDRYLRLKHRAEMVVERMHPVLGHSADIEGLAALVDAFERVALHGDRIEVTSAQRVAADRRAAAAEADAAGAERQPSLPGGEVEGLSPTPAVLVVKQTPPVAKPGRGRGFRLKEDGADA